MSAEIIAFPLVSIERKGNGARETIEQYFATAFQECPTDLSAVDHFLAWLWAEGYMIMPVPEDDGAA